MKGAELTMLKLIESSDKVARLSEAGYAYETKLRELEHQFESKAAELREAYLAAVAKDAEKFGTMFGRLLPTGCTTSRKSGFKFAHFANGGGARCLVVQETIGPSAPRLIWIARSPRQLAQ